MPVDVNRLQQRILRALQKLNDKGTQHIGSTELHAIIEELTQDVLTVFISCVCDADHFTFGSTFARKETLRLLGVAAETHGDELAHFLPRIVSFVTRRIKDNDVQARAACAQALGVVARHVNPPPSKSPALGVYLSPLFALMKELTINMQTGAAMCIASVIANRTEDLRFDLERLGAHLVKVTMASSTISPAYLCVALGTIVNELGEHALDHVPSFVEALLHVTGSSDWTARKAAAEALVVVALRLGPLLAAVKDSAAKELDSHRFDKYKPVRTVMVQALQLFRDLPESDGTTPPIPPHKSACVFPPEVHVHTYWEGRQPYLASTDTAKASRSRRSSTNRLTLGPNDNNNNTLAPPRRRGSAGWRAPSLQTAEEVLSNPSSNSVAFLVSSSPPVKSQPLSVVDQLMEGDASLPRWATPSSNDPDWGLRVDTAPSPERSLEPVFTTHPSPLKTFNGSTDVLEALKALSVKVESGMSAIHNRLSQLDSRVSSFDSRLAAVEQGQRSQRNVAQIGEPVLSRLQALEKWQRNIEEHRHPAPVSPIATSNVSFAFRALPDEAPAQPHHDRAHRPPPLRGAPSGAARPEEDSSSLRGMTGRAEEGTPRRGHGEADFEDRLASEGAGSLLKEVVESEGNEQQLLQLLGETVVTFASMDPRTASAVLARLAAHVPHCRRSAVAPVLHWIKQGLAARVRLGASARDELSKALDSLASAPSAEGILAAQLYSQLSRECMED